MIRTRTLRLPAAHAARYAGAAAVLPTQRAAPAAAGGRRDRAGRACGIDSGARSASHRLTSDTGWLTLAGLFWLQAKASNTFGSAPGQRPGARQPGARRHGRILRAHRLAGALHRPTPGAASRTMARRSRRSYCEADASGDPTVLASGTLRFFVIERAGKSRRAGARPEQPAPPRSFAGCSTSRSAPSWVLNARFVPYRPARHIRIVNILGMEEEDVLTRRGGVHQERARVATRHGARGARATSELFIMFADGTSGHETYGGGRFLYIPRPSGDTRAGRFQQGLQPAVRAQRLRHLPAAAAAEPAAAAGRGGREEYAGGPGHHPEGAS